MGNSYSAWNRDSIGLVVHPSRALERLRSRRTADDTAGSSMPGGLQLSRLVILTTVVLLLTFSGFFRLTDTGGVHAFWLEIALALAQLSTLAASYAVAAIRRHIGDFVRLFCLLTAGLFVAIAAANGFNSNYAVGLLFIIPGLGVGFGVATRAPRSLGLFFLVTCSGAAAASLLTVGPGSTSYLFIASLVCLSSVTLAVATGWLDARRRYLASEQRYRAVVEQASDGIFLLDAVSLEILDANPAFCRMLGISLSEMQSVSIRRFLEETGGGPIAAGTLACGPSHPIECVVRRSDGTRIIGELKVDRIRHNDGEVLSVVVHDITSRKEYEQRLVRAKDAAEEIARFKTALMTNMSHEIRTPLSSILGWTAVLGNEVPARQRELVRLIEKSGRRLHHTLDSVIELAHLQANVKEVRSSRFDLNVTVRQTADLMRADADVKGLSLNLRVPDEPTWVRSDPACLRRVLMHVLDNAIKFTESGCVTISVDRVGAELALVVEDTGVGIGREFIAVAFDEFKQESEGLSRAHEGSGLGLALVRRLMELLGGRVDVASEPGVGTSFTVYLPYRPEAVRPA